MFQPRFPRRSELRRFLVRIGGYFLPVALLVWAVGSVRWTGVAACLCGLPAEFRQAQRAPAAGGREAEIARIRQPWQTLEQFGESNIQLCQALCAPPQPTYPVRPKHTDTPYRADGGFEDPCGPQFQRYYQGEYVARPRPAHVPHYRLRPEDECDFIFRLTRDETSTPYQINVGDEIKVESSTDHNLDRSLIVQPDGTVTLGLLGQVRATHHTVTQLRDELEDRYKKYYKVPAITLTPLKVNTKLEDIRATVDSRAGFGGQTRHGRVTPEGTVGLPAIGSVPAQGLTLEELKREINERYDAEVQGLEVTPVLTLRAPRFVFVQGEVRNPGRYAMEGPTTVMQAITVAGGWNVGANIEQVVVFRRDEQWQLVATMVDLRQAFLGRRSAPPGEIWAADYDLIIVPKSNILLFDNFAQLVFTNAIYRIVPFATSINFTTLSGTATAAAATTVITHP